MTAEEYWDGDNRLCKAYREADRLKRMRKNNEDYRLGAYFYNALADVSPLFRFTMRQSVKAEPYLEKPFPIDEQEAEERELAEQEESLNRLLEKLRADAKKAREKKKTETEAVK